MRRSQRDLLALEAHPSLVSFRGRGRLLDRLPTASMGGAFGCALLAWFAVYGAKGAVLVVAWTLAGLVVAARSLLAEDLRHARSALTLARSGLLVALAVAVLAVLAGPVGPVGPAGPAAGSPSSGSSTTGISSVRDDQPRPAGHQRHPHRRPNGAAKAHAITTAGIQG